uniref:multicopper oxidase domain-containing protein n=1 Tax=Trinickia mobilis TaxID=2816356 RepID=UPI001A8EFB63|nr:multicopper oxidase domain-containing protein [Trinickia mobilis]
MIDVREGDTVEITFINGLPQPSTIHWHGMPVPPDQDGNPSNPVASAAARSSSGRSRIAPT